MILIRLLLDRINDIDGSNGNSNGATAATAATSATAATAAPERNPIAILFLSLFFWLSTIRLLVDRMNDPSSIRKDE